MTKMRDQLQWSHVFSDMVRARTVRQAFASIRELQWSQVFSDMVRLQSGDKLPTYSVGFNGAMSFQTW